jgi:hypothetical protein
MTWQLRCRASLGLLAPFPLYPAAHLEEGIIKRVVRAARRAGSRGRVPAVVLAPVAAAAAATALQLTDAPLLRAASQVGLPHVLACL